MSPKSKKSCPNCKDDLVKPTYHCQFKCYYCPSCQVVVSRKKPVFTLDLSDNPKLQQLVATYRRMKALSAVYSWCETLKVMYANERGMPQQFGADLDLSVLIDDSVPLARKLPTCVLLDNLKREQRLRNFRRTNYTHDGDTAELVAKELPSSLTTEQLRALANCDFFAKARAHQQTIGLLDFVRIKLRADQLFLKKIEAEATSSPMGGQFHGTPGNAAEKASTRLWRAIRFLEQCNKIAHQEHPDGNEHRLLDLDFNGMWRSFGKIPSDNDALADGVKLKRSRERVRLLLKEAYADYTNGCVPRAFCVRVTRKEARTLAPSKVPLFIKELEETRNRDPQKVFRVCGPKSFSYIVVMAPGAIVQKDTSAENGARTNLFKMGDTIWLANVYATQRMLSGMSSD